MTIGAAYVPVVGIRKRLDFAGDYLTCRSETEKRSGEIVDTLDQKGELQRMTCVEKQCWLTSSQVLCGSSPGNSDKSRAAEGRNSNG